MEDESLYFDENNNIDVEDINGWTPLLTGKFAFQGRFSCRRFELLLKVCYTQLISD